MEEKKKTPEIYPYKKFTFDKGAKAIQQTKRISFLKTNGVGITRHPFEKRKKKKTNKTRTRTEGARTTYSFN